MSNLIYVSTDITCHKSKSGDLYITSTVKVPGFDIKTGMKQELIYKPKRNKDLKLEAWQLLCVVNGKSLDDNDTTLKLKNVQAYLLKGDQYNPYYLIRVRLYEGISLSIFLNDIEINLVTKFIKLNGEFKEKGQYEIMPFENPTRV